MATARGISHRAPDAAGWMSMRCYVSANRDLMQESTQHLVRRITGMSGRDGGLLHANPDQHALREMIERLEEAEMERCHHSVSRISEDA